MKNSESKQQNKFRKNVLKIISGGVAVFAFGIFIGYQLNHGAISSIQGYLFNAASEATDANATDANATDANATDANATDANATDANASSTDNIIYLNSLSLGATSVNAGDKVTVNDNTSGACNRNMSITFINNSTKNTFTVNVESIVDNPYITIPNNAASGTYSIKSVYLVGDNSDGTTFSKTYTSSDFNFDVTLTINQTSTEKLSLNSISLKTNSANIGDKIYFTYDTSTKISNIKFEFVNASEEKMIVYGKSLDNNPYFEIPSSTTTGTYTLSVLTISSSSKTNTYSKDGSVNGSTTYNFNLTLEIKDSNKDNYIYNNEDINSTILATLYNADSNTKITINANSNPIISKELFNAIKGTNKKLIINYNEDQLIFTGKDIKTSKDIDVSVSTSLVIDDENINKLVSDGIIINFAANGDLPGTATTKIKITDEMSSKLGNKPIYVYYYNEDSNDFSIIAKKVNAKDGYYEFKLSHNSRYLLSNTKLDDTLISENNNNVVSFQLSNAMNIILIILGILLIIAVIVVIIIVKKKKEKKNK